MITSFLLFGYFGPETVLPVTSIVATIAGLAMMFGRHTFRLIMSCGRLILTRQGRDQERVRDESTPTAAPTIRDPAIPIAWPPVKASRMIKLPLELGGFVSPGTRQGREYAADMKILVIGLDCAAPELLLGDERLENFRRLMDAGCYGRLESIIPPITVPAWMCMATSQDPGSLGVYGFRNRVDHSYDGLGIVNSRSIDALAIWDQVAREGKRRSSSASPRAIPPARSTASRSAAS